MMGILVGTDFNRGGVKGIGPKKALKLVQEYKDNYEKMFESLNPWFNWKDVYDECTIIAFTEYGVKKNDLIGLVFGNGAKITECEYIDVFYCEDKEEFIFLGQNAVFKMHRNYDMYSGKKEKSTAETLRELAGMKQKSDALKRANDKKEKDIKELEKRNAKEKLKQLAGE